MALALLAAPFAIYLFLLLVVIPIGLAAEKIDAWRRGYIVASR